MSKPKENRNIALRRIVFGIALLGCSLATAATYQYRGYSKGLLSSVSGSATPAVPAATDPYFGNVALLMHMNGTNGAVSFIDQKGATVSYGGAAALTTSQFKYGTAALALPSGNSYLRIANNGDKNLGTSDFTVESWIKPGSAKKGTIIANWGWGIGYRGGWAFVLQSDGSLVFATNDTATIASAAGSVPVAAWTHVAVTRQGSAWRIFANGTQVGGVTSTMSIPDVNPIYGAVPDVVVGVTFADGNPYDLFDGLIDDVRITRGVSRYNASFAPPTTEFPDQ
jgi:hypothetical protein